MHLVAGLRGQDAAGGIGSAHLRHELVESPTDLSCEEDHFDGTLWDEFEWKQLGTLSKLLSYSVHCVQHTFFLKIAPRGTLGEDVLTFLKSSETLFSEHRFLKADPEGARGLP